MPAKSSAFVRTLKVWNQRSAERRSLRRDINRDNVAMIERDIGLAPGSLLREASKPFWRS
ncbi:DUF1127 domain-containing protein [Marinobacter sp. BGYM27]|uniref:DUF1127 domain-containing protein n=1 Tax=unclassified Marinobacter TaxID=83889 RepID=UPI0021A25F69|nr:DUF1127 domain-containing protein [Marinobacter sp. BGYM27]MDG5499956.1 DUF1127 domain-containing protein [Marinobacter sp. BGYM27]